MLVVYVDVLVDVRAGFLVCSLVGFSQQIFCHDSMVFDAGFFPWGSLGPSP